MNHIEEMMKTAGVDYYDKYYSCTDRPIAISCKNRCDYCNKSKEVFCYHDFSVEKQLELIKLILCSDDIDELNQYYNETRKCYVFNALSLPDEAGFKSGWTAENKDYTLALAEFTTILMASNELDKTKVKEILEI